MVQHIRLLIIVGGENDVVDDVFKGLKKLRNAD